MNDLRTAAQQALEAIEQTRRLMPDSYYYERLHKAATALKAALAEPVQEPVAWMWAPSEHWPSDFITTKIKAHAEFALTHGMKVTPLYAAHPQRLPLTEEEIHDCFQQRHRDKAVERRMITRAIERAHGIGGEA